MKKVLIVKDGGLGVRQEFRRWYAEMLKTFLENFKGTEAEIRLIENASDVQNRCQLMQADLAIFVSGAMHEVADELASSGCRAKVVMVASGPGIPSGQHRFLLVLKDDEATSKLLAMI